MDQPLFNREAIERYIPQREPFIFVDEVVELEPSKWIRSVLHLTGQAPFFAGHFPGDPVFPGVLILENMAQTAGVLVGKTNEASAEAGESRIGAGGPRLVFGMVNRARFLKPVIPPADLVTEVTVVKLLSRSGIVEAVSRVGDEQVATAKLQFGAIG